jgi:hypothetical protein
MTARSLTASRSVLDATLPFALPIGLSAFLLFSVEPLIGRLVLPVFGGTPAVWATVLFFFQAVLLAGYAYGHLSVTLFGRWGPPIHLAIAAIGFVTLINAASNLSALRNAAVTPVVDLLFILIGLIGLPAFVLTTTTPLLSGWFHAARGDRQGDPYWLYALSNAGSLVALLGYPLLIEPRLGLGAQRGIWAVAYVVLVALIGWAALRALPDIVARPRGYALAPEQRLVASAGAEAVPAIDWPRRLRWLLLAAVPSGLLSAVTNFLTTDLVSAPFLWVIPLSIYLFSFVVAFSPRSGPIIAAAVAAAPAMVTLLWVPYGSAGGWPIFALLATELLAFAVVAIALHGRLAHDRPGPDHLTEFYLIIAIGGALASAFVALFAPNFFPNIWEYPILLVGALAGLALVAAPSTSSRTTGGLQFGPFFTGLPTRLLPYILLGGALAAVLVVTESVAAEAGVRWLLVGGLILLVGGRPWFLVLSTAVVLALASLVLQPEVEFRSRSFFGVTEVLGVDDGASTVLMNGTTVHGTQFSDAGRQRTPTTYYGIHGPAGDIFAVGADSSAVDPKAIGIVGLGAGTLAAYKDNWMTMTYFEIDPVVIQVAQDPTYFTFLSSAPGAPDIVEGDARLSLASQPDGRYDLLVLDAFSSDSVPVHLITLEAIKEQARTVAQDGVIAFHISNRYYDLAPAIGAALDELGLIAVQRDGDGSGDGEIPSRWLAASRSPERLEAFRALGWQLATPADHPFTDDYADLLSYLKLGF